MSSIIKLKEMKENLTKSEKKLSEYILDNLEDVKDINTYTLAERSGTSQATIIRFSKKLGYSGFPAFKIALSEDLGKRSTKSKDGVIHNEISIDDSYGDIAKKVVFENVSALKDTFSILEEKSIEDAVNLLSSANRVLILGAGYSGLVGRDFHYKLMEIGKTTFYDSDTHIQMTNMAVMDEDDLIFVISHKGNSQDIHNVVKMGKSRGIKIISLTRLLDNPISSLADIALHTVAENVAFRSTAISSRIAQLSIIDVLYIGLVRKNYEQAQKYLSISSELVQPLKID